MLTLFNRLTVLSPILVGWYCHMDKATLTIKLEHKNDKHGYYCVRKYGTKTQTRLCLLKGLALKQIE